MNTLQQIWDRINNVDVSIEEKDIKNIGNTLDKSIINLGLMLIIVAVVIVVIIKKVR